MKTIRRRRVALGIAAALFAVSTLDGMALASNSYRSTLYFQGALVGASRYYGGSGCGCSGPTINISYTMNVAVNKYGISYSSRTWQVAASHDWTWGPFSGSDSLGWVNNQPYKGYTSVSWKMVGNGNYHFEFLKDYTDGITLTSDNVKMWSQC
jgi:hypothetical protein